MIKNRSIKYLIFNFKKMNPHTIKTSQISALKTVESPSKYLPKSVSPIKHRLNAW
jgi:hypothetical protein